MAQPFVGEIRMFAGNFELAGWAFCDGRLLPISENEVLFTLIGTTYGGDGESTFALPDLRGRIPIHQGNGFILAETGGAEEVTLTVNQIPAHTPPAPRDARASRTSPRPPTTCSPSRRPPTSTSRTPPRPRSRPARSRPSAAASRTRTSSRTSASTTSSRCSASSPDSPKEDRHGPVRSRDPHLPVQLRARRAGRGATASSCRSRRTRRCSRCSARRTAATASRTSRCPTSRAAPPMHPGQGPGLSLHDLGETGGSETVTLLESRDPDAHARAARQHRHRRRTDPVANARSIARSQNANAYKPPPDSPRSAVAGGAGAGGRRPAAQQPAALPDLLLQHRPPGRLPAAHVTAARHGVGSRCARSTDDDREFLLAVYASTRAEELAPGRRGRRAAGGVRAHAVRRPGHALPPSTTPTAPST